MAPRNIIPVKFILTEKIMKLVQNENIINKDLLVVIGELKMEFTINIAVDEKMLHCDRVNRSYFYNCVEVTYGFSSEQINLNS